MSSLDDDFDEDDFDEDGDYCTCGKCDECLAAKLEHREWASRARRKPADHDNELFSFVPRKNSVRNTQVNYRMAFGTLRKVKRGDSGFYTVVLPKAVPEKPRRSIRSLRNRGMERRQPDTRPDPKLVSAGEPVPESSEPEKTSVKVRKLSQEKPKIPPMPLLPDKSSRFGMLEY